MSSLCNALKDLIKWDKFADNLGIRQPDIDRIRLENKEDIEGQKRALFDTWLRRDIKASWDTVLCALDSGGEEVLADNIRTKLGLRRQSSGFSDRSFGSEGKRWEGGGEVEREVERKGEREREGGGLRERGG